jgi:hypothetical protein
VVWRLNSYSLPGAVLICPLCYTSVVGSLMGYYCSDCKQTISEQEFYFSMNRYKKALCSTHQLNAGLRGTTKDLQELVRQRHADEAGQEAPKLLTIKDWIAADFETWAKEIKRKEDEGRRGRK